MQGNIPRKSCKLTEKCSNFYPTYYLVALYSFMMTVITWALKACNWG